MSNHGDKATLGTAGQPITSNSGVHGIMAEFESAEDLLAATRKTMEGGFTRVEAYSPLPIEGLAEVLGFRTRLPLIVLVAGIIGAVSGFFLQYWISVIDYPMNVGGRPFNSWPAFIPVTFECTVLFAGVTAVVAMIALNGLPQPYHAVFNVPQFERASNDRFFLTIEADDPQFDKAQTGQFLKSLNPVAVHQVGA